MRVPSGRLRWLLVGAAAVLLGATLAGGDAVYRLHVRRMTGRTGVPRVSCLHCHRRPAPPPSADEIPPTPWVSPSGLAVSPDGKRLYVAASGSSRLLEVDLATQEVARAVPLPGSPHAVAVSGDGRRVAVSIRHLDQVLLLDADTLSPVAAVPAVEPVGVKLSRDGARLFVANASSDQVAIVRPEGGEPSRRVTAGNEPFGIAHSETTDLLAVVNRAADPVGPGEVPASELTLVSGRQGRVLERRILTSALMGESVALSSGGDFALAPVIRVRNLLPLTQVARGAVMNSTLVFAETRAGGRTVQLPLDEVNAYFADPAGIALTPDDRLAFVAHGGARVLTAVDVAEVRRLVESGTSRSLDMLSDDLGASARYVLARIPTREDPGALALSPDGRRLYVAERLADSIAVVDTLELRVCGRIQLGEGEPASAERRGERVFHDASITFQGQFSCRSCHPDGHTDGLIWDFEIDGVGRNLLETRSLRGIRDTPPFKWNGKNPNLATQCGPRFARVLTRSDPFSPGDLADLVAYIESIPRAPTRAEALDAEARARGEALFFRTRSASGEPIPVADRCSTCHRPPLFTDRLPAEVGTGGRFDTPHLFGVGSSPPYLHDGRAATLEEIWTVYSREDTHGVTSDLSKAQLNDLVLYLRSL